MKDAPPPASPAYQISLSRIKDLPQHRRPREIAREAGIQNVPDDVLVAILLRAGIRGQSVIDLARQVLDRHQGSLTRLAEASLPELRAIKGIGAVKAITLSAALELGRRAAAIILAHNHPSGDPTPSAEDIRSTRQLVSTGQVVGIQVLDHIIIGGHRPHPAPYISLREAGLVDFS